MIDEMGISARSVTVSTVGIVPGIRQLAAQGCDGKNWKAPRVGLEPTTKWINSPAHTVRPVRVRGVESRPVHES